MRIAVTGASGFVGRWLTTELEGAGHAVLSPRERVDVRDAHAMRAWFRAGRPDAVAHLAAVAAPREVAAAPDVARAIAVDGTIHVLEALADVAPMGIALVAGSSEVYGRPTSLPLDESMPPAPETPYGEVKAVQEAIALERGGTLGLRIVTTRSFNHTGPGQRTTFAIPAFAARIVAAQRSGSATFSVGNLDVRRDLSDVRDVTNAYRLLLEHAAGLGGGSPGLVVNVGSGRSVLLRAVVASLVRLAGGGVEPVTDPALVRLGEAPEIRADIRRIQELTGWQPRIELDQTLADVLAAASRDVASGVTLR